MKMKLTPERKAIRDAQELKWYDGYAGAATSYPYRVVQYLSKELSDKITAEAEAKAAEWIAKCNAIPLSKRYDNHGCGSWCKELEPQWLAYYDDVNAIPTTVLGHKIYIKILDSYRKGNGQYGIKPMDKMRLLISPYVNSVSVGGGWHRNDRMNFEIVWDEEKQLFYVATYYRASSGAVEISRKNWGRTKARKIFMHEVESLEDRLTNESVQIGELKLSEPTLGWKRGLESKFIACVGPEIAA